MKNLRTTAHRRLQLKLPRVGGLRIETAAGLRTRIWRFPKSGEFYRVWLAAADPEQGLKAWMQKVAAQSGGETNFTEARWWSIPQAIAWICLRDGARASALLEGRRLISELRIWLEAEECRQMEPERASVPWWEGERLLLASLRQGVVGSRGTPLRSNAKEDRALEDWDWSHACKLPVDSPYVPDEDRMPLFEKVRISAMDVMKRWPEVGAHKPAKQNVGMATLREWVGETIEAHKVAGQPYSLDLISKLAAVKFGRGHSGSVRELYPQMEKRGPGRPPKNPAG